MQAHMPGSSGVKRSPAGMQAHRTDHTAVDTKAGRQSGRQQHSSSKAVPVRAKVSSGRNKLHHCAA